MLPLLNYEIVKYNRHVFNINAEILKNKNRDKFPLKKIKEIENSDEYNLWIELIDYVYNELKETIYYHPFKNYITNQTSHTKFELTNQLSKSTYYNYVAKCFDIIKEYMLYNHLMIL